MRPIRTSLLAPTERLRDAVRIGEVYYAVDVSPHALTTRWTYTVPTGRAALVYAAEVLAMRYTAAITVQLIEATISVIFTTAIGVFLLSNTVGDSRHAVVSQLTPLRPGDYLTGATRDSSTGGTGAYIICFNGLEFPLNPS